MEHFRTYWDECGETPNPLEARQPLVSEVIDRVLVYDEEIVAVVLHGNFAIVLDENRTAPAMVADAVSEVLLSEGITPTLDSSRCGSDGRRTLTGCIIWAPKNKIYHLVLQQLVPTRKAA